MRQAHVQNVHPFVRVVNLLQEFSLPLIAGVVLGLVAANVNSHWYHLVVDFHAVANLPSCLATS